MPLPFALLQCPSVSFVLCGAVSFAVPGQDGPGRACRFRFANPLSCFTNLLLIRPAQPAPSPSAFHFSGQTQFGMIRLFEYVGVTRGRWGADGGDVVIKKGGGAHVRTA